MKAVMINDEDWGFGVPNQGMGDFKRQKANWSSADAWEQEYKDEILMTWCALILDRIFGGGGQSNLSFNAANFNTQYATPNGTVTGLQLAQNMVSEWSSMSGLNLTLDSKTGLVKENGVLKNTGISLLARVMLRRMMSGGKVTIDFSQNGGSEAAVGGNKITLGVNEIEEDIKNTPGSLVSTTLGYGMTTFHEWFHTKAGGSFEHSSDTFLGSSYETRLDKPDIEVNKIRAELSASTGLNYGQKGAYTGVWWWDKNGENGNNYSPMAQLTFLQWNQMQNAMRNKDVSLLPNIVFVITPMPNLPR